MWPFMDDKKKNVSPKRPEVLLSNTKIAYEDSPPTVALLRHNTTREFWLLNYGIEPHYRSPMDTGPLIVISAEEFQSRGIEIVLENMKGFSTRDVSVRSALATMSREEKRRVRMERKFINIMLDTPVTLVLIASYKVDETLVRLPCSPEKFNGLILQCLDRASDDW